MAINFTGNVALKEKIFRVLKANELRAGQDPYILTPPPGGNSGWSYGWLQFDLASKNMIGCNAFVRILLEATDNAGNYIIDDGNPTTGRGSVTAVDDNEVWDLYSRAIKKPNALTPQDIIDINKALDSSQGRQIIDDSVDLQISDLITYADNIIQKAPAADQDFLRKDIGYLWLIDIKNQGFSGLSGFLNGNSINGYTKQGAFTFDDLVNVYFRQRQILIEKRNKEGQRTIPPSDPFRRLANIVKETGYTPANLDEAKGVLRAYTYLYVRYEAELLETTGRVKAVNDFRDFITKPANDMIFDNWQSGWGPKPTSYDDILMGDDRANYNDSGDYQLNGRDGNDIIFGEGGNDHIEGGKGDDILFGGEGNDTYIYTIGDGNDRIIDEDNNGRIVIFDSNGQEINRRVLGNFYKSGENEWKLPDGSKITVSHNSPYKITLPDGSTITLGDNFQDGDFGIHLLDTPSDPTIENTILGNEAANLLRDTAGNDRIESGSGNDGIWAGNGGGNWILGGEGNDTVVSFDTSGADIIEGGTGIDTLSGGGGDDRIFGENYGEMEDIIAAGEVAPSVNQKGDLLSGAAGNDFLYGTDKKDALLGGDGHDLLVGGGGDDVIFGDRTLAGTFIEPSLLQGNWDQIDDYGYYLLVSSLDRDGVNTYYPVNGMPGYYGVAPDKWSIEYNGQNLAYRNVYLDANQGTGDDTIYAGTGNDFVIAGKGDDEIDAGSGNDIVEGGEGSDSIFGGAGNDELHGDASDIAISAQGHDYIDGGAGDDTLYGYAGDDDIFGGEGHDLLVGRKTNIMLKLAA